MTEGVFNRRRGGARITDENDDGRRATLARFLASLFGSASSRGLQCASRYCYPPDSSAPFFVVWRLTK
eukprot:scaffold26347_cov24-Attheya_sp.AAC.1